MSAILDVIGSLLLFVNLTFIVYFWVAFHKRAKWVQNEKSRGKHIMFWAVSVVCSLILVLV